MGTSEGCKMMRCENWQEEEIEEEEEEEKEEEKEEEGVAVSDKRRKRVL